METRGLKVNLKTAKLMFMGREPAVRPQRCTHVGFAAKELEQTQYGVNVVKSGAIRDVWGSEIGEKQEITLDVQCV